MKLKILNENDTINSSNESNNPIINSIMQDLEFNKDKWTSLLYEYSQKIFGIPVNSMITYNEKLSNAVTNIFKSTKVNVYIFAGKKALCIGIPGANKNVTPEFLRSEAARQAEINSYNRQAIVSDIALRFATNGKYKGSLPQMSHVSSSIYETTANAIRNNNKKGGETKLIYDPNINKLDCNIEEVTIYISTTYIRCMENDDELIASIIFEISKNTLLFKKYITNNVIGAAVVVSLFTIIPLTAGITYLITNGNQNSAALSASLSFLVIIGFLLIVSMYYSKRRKIEYDEFVIKCGYGNALNRAIDNYNKFIFANDITSSQAMRALNIFDNISHFFTKMGTYIYNFFSKLHLTSSQSIQARHDMIDDKTKKYNYNLINRSHRI